MTERTVKVDYIARVEGEGALRIRLQDDQVKDVELRIFEPPRYFEAFLRGRSYLEAADITSRICGICPVAYQMTAVQALEGALGMDVGDPVRRLRRLLYAGEWIESHALHMFLLHMPDMLGFPDAIRMAERHAKLVQDGLELKRTGNAIMEAVGGRPIHPVNVRVGGFYRAPSHEELSALVPSLERAVEIAESTLRFAATLPVPQVQEDYEFVALRGSSEYPMNEGELASSSGLRCPPERFEEEFEEVQVPWSHALQAHRKGGGAYLVGPLARLALNRDLLTPRAKAMAHELGIGREVRNPYRSLLARGLETLLACEEALRLIQGYERPEPSFTPPPSPHPPSTGRAATEAPRGLLYHRYVVGEDSAIREARLVPPTSQNQARIELDVRHLVERSLHLKDEELGEVCERAIRNHDPCISCATHFLELEVERR